MSQPLKQCPVCGGAIHPIAGRCKHCKTDLVKLEEHAIRSQRAARMDAPAAMPSGHTAVPSPASGSVTPSTPTGTRVPPMVAHQSSTWSRRWPLAVGGFALLAIGISVGVLVGQSSDDAAEPSRRANPARSPHMIPDNMPQPSPPHSRAPSAPGMPGTQTPNRTAPNSTAPTAATFHVALTEAVCSKLTDCGQIDDFSVLLCKELAGQLEDPDAEAKVKSGECTYDPGAATTCLDTIGSLDCGGQAADVMSLMSQAGSLFECTSVYVCF